jgi:DNA-binding MarR family transcriptional regulator
MEEAIEGASESAVRAARDVVVAFSRLRRRLKEVADIQDLTPSQASVLHRLGKDGASSASALAVAEHVRPQSMAATLTALDQHRLIQRHPDPEDGRRQLITLTAAGRERYQGNRQAREEWLVRALQEHCTEKQRHVVIEAMALLEGLTHA